LDGSPRTIQKKQLMMQINSDRRALININKNGNNTLDKKQKFKNITPVGKGDKNMTSFNINNNFNNNVKINSSFNYKDIIPQKKESKNAGFAKKIYLGMILFSTGVYLIIHFYRYFVLKREDVFSE